jgi:ABC-type antimicrobial peptide transport system permease subunit
LYARYSDATSGLPPATTIRALSLKIVGVASQSSGGNNSSPGVSDIHPVGLILPYQTITANWEDMAKANNWVGDEFSGITAIVDDPANGDAVAKEMKDAGYPAQSGKAQLKQLFQILTFLEIGLAAFAAIALVVALLGTANTMFTAVRERTRDIGILKALGARSSDVLTMFVVEAATLGVVAGLVAILFTLLVAAIANPLINGYAHSNGVPKNFSVTLLQLSPLTALGAIALGAVACGLAGALPSLRAARLNPVSSLRYE